MHELRELGLRRVLLASVTPLASIFGSGFLIIVPVLERAIGGLAVLGAAGVCAFAWVVGSAVRHNIAEIEPRLAAGTLDRPGRALERISDVAIAIAYVISVALYLRIMAEYVIGYVDPGADTVTALLASGAVALIVAVGVFRGFSGLDVMERVALGAVLVLTTVLGGAFVISDLGQVAGHGLTIPGSGDPGLVEALLMLGGIVITVQGFETVRYLGEAYDARTRIWASRVAQAVAASIYIGFVAAATPLMGIVGGGSPDADLLDITARIAPALSLPVVFCAVLSQFSAATADTEAAAGNLRQQLPRLMGGPVAYVLSGAAAILMIWTIPTLTIVTVASRAFAGYYCLQCVTASRTSTGWPRRLGFGALAVVLLAVTLFAEPVG